MITGAGMLDINGLVSQLVSADRAGSDLKLNRESSKINMKLSALGTLKGAVSTLQGALSGLNNVSNYGKRSVTSSSAALSATVGSLAVTGSYSIDVNQLATAHALASPAFADSDTTLGTGTLTFRFGTTDYDSEAGSYAGFELNPDSKTATLTIDSSNNTLQGVMKAINDAKFGVKASIINDGTGDRLLLSSEHTGEANSIEISVSDDDGGDSDASGLSRLAFNANAAHMEQTNAAQNALFRINGLSVTSQENTTKAIPGMNLTLKETTNSPVTLTVGDDTSAAGTAFTTFINAYNQFRTTINNLTSYDVATNTAGPLLGDFTVRAVVSQVDGILRQMVEGVTGSFGSLAEVGLKTSSNGTFTLDQDAFRTALTSEPQAVAQLFAALGVASDPGVDFSSAPRSTQAGNYDVHVTALATTGFNTGTGVLPDFSLGHTLVIDDSNDSLGFKIDGIDVGQITLTAGEYTSGAALANELQARINGAEAMSKANRKVVVSWDESSASLRIESTTFGSRSRIEITSVDTNTAATLGFDVGEGVAGNDVEGTIGGVAARGSAQLLTAGAGTPAEGLSLIISGGLTGDRGSVNFTRGISDQLRTLLDRVLENEGSLEGRIDTLEARKKEVANTRERMEARWKSVEARYRMQFTALDSLITSLQSTSSYLETQLANLPKPNSVGR